MSKLVKTTVVILPLITAALPAQAYIGPGMGAGAIAVVLGILAAIVMGFFAVLWYPIKRFLKKRKAAKEMVSEISGDPSS